MSVARIPGPLDIAVSGLRAQSMRLRVIADNIANAGTSRTQAGGPYRRQQVVLSTDGKALGGVRVRGVVPDLVRPFKGSYMPGHPDADEHGMVQMPNVDLPVEMMDMVVASRAYQANAAMLKRYQNLVNAALELLR